MSGFFALMRPRGVTYVADRSEKRSRCRFGRPALYRAAKKSLCGPRHCIHRVAERAFSYRAPDWPGGASLPADEVKRFADAMLVFGAGSLAGLASAFFAYISRTFRLERPTLIGWRRPLRWCAILAAIVGAVCFIGALNMSRVAVVPKEAPAAPSTGTGTAQPEPPAPSSSQP
jgi:hypothetical protein